MAKHYYQCPHCKAWNEVDFGAPTWGEMVETVGENIPEAIVWTVAATAAEAATLEAGGVGGLVVGGAGLARLAKKVELKKVKQFLNGYRANCASCGYYFGFNKKTRQAQA